MTDGAGERMEPEDRLREAAKQVKFAAKQPRSGWSDRAEADLLEIEKDLRGIAAVAENRRDRSQPTPINETGPTDG